MEKKVISLVNGQNVNGGSLLLIIYVCIHGAVCYEAADKLVEMAIERKPNILLTFIDMFKERLAAEPFWDKAGRLFLQAIFFFIVGGFIPAERNMNTVLALIRMLKIEEEQDNLDSDLDLF